MTWNPQVIKGTSQVKSSHFAQRSSQVTSHEKSWLVLTYYQSWLDLSQLWQLWVQVWWSCCTHSVLITIHVQSCFSHPLSPCSIFPRKLYSNHVHRILTYCFMIITIYWLVNVTWFIDRFGSLHKLVRLLFAVTGYVHSETFFCFYVKGPFAT